MSAITLHILDTSQGKPGVGIPVVLEYKTHSSGWQNIANGITNIDGRINDLLSPNDVFQLGHYRLIFETDTYFLLSNIECFFPHITVSFVVKDTTDHYHVPLLLSPFGYTTYRGS